MCPVIPWRDFVSGDTGKRIQSAAIGSSQSRHGVSRNTSGTFEQQWGLDATGNWKTFKQDNDGNGTWELNQTRTANKANEITGISNSTGAAWATPTYDRAGNMIGIPNAGATNTGATIAWTPLTEAQWDTLTEAQWDTLTENTGTTPQQLSAKYDAWNRLVSITNGTQKVSEHVYDARGYRIRKDAYASGTLTEARHYYYTPGWQCVEERVDASTTLERQFIWGQAYAPSSTLAAEFGARSQRRGVQMSSYSRRSTRPGG